MTSKPPRKPGYALNRADYLYHIRLLIDSGLSYFLDARIRRDDALQSVDTIWDNETRRLIDLQLPNWISIACTNGRFSRANAVEQAVAKSEGRTDQHWARGAKALEENNKEDHRTKWLPDRQRLKTTFFSWVRKNCAAALTGRAPERMRVPQNGCLTYGTMSRPRLLTISKRRSLRSTSIQPIHSGGVIG